MGAKCRPEHRHQDAKVRYSLGASVLCGQSTATRSSAAGSLPLRKPAVGTSPPARLLRSRSSVRLRRGYTCLLFLHTSAGKNPAGSVPGRQEAYAQYFESNRYTTDNNFTSIAAELNSRLFDGRGTNVLRLTWSHQNEPRSFVGDNFPTVDILENYGTNKAVLTSFGPDPFTYGNLRDVHTVVTTLQLLCER